MSTVTFIYASQGILASFLSEKEFEFSVSVLIFFAVLPICVALHLVKALLKYLKTTFNIPDNKFLRNVDNQENVIFHLT